MKTPQALRQAARRVLGPCEMTAAVGAAITRVVTVRGDEFIIKQHTSRAKHNREVHAYRYWAPALGCCVPELVAVDAAAMIVITTVLPGQPRPGDMTAEASRQAGMLLRRFHDAEPPSELPWFQAWLQDRTRFWVGRAAALLTESDSAVIAGHLAALENSAIPLGNPCHLDFQPRNWLISDSGHVSLIDFEHSRVDLPVRDLVRLRFRVWPCRPDLRDAFFEGYGRTLTDAEDELVWHLGAIDALTALARGRETHDPELTASGLSTLRQLRGRT
jgi:Ser/Thr protein kinase RdoA (MazF antagonist)